MNDFSRSKIAFLVTGNIHKFHEARKVLAQHNIATAMLNIEAVEIQDNNLKKIAITSALDAARRSGLPIFVEDAGLFVKALKGFPGPYSSYVFRKLGTKGILKLMQNVNNRRAHFLSVVAFCGAEQTSPKSFSGKVEGTIAHKEHGRQGFGFDPIFQPDTESGKTFAQMTTEEKNKYSHRSLAMRKFALWYRLHY